jgi:hypothetical protein
MILLESLTNILEITCTRFRAGLFWFVQVLVVFVACPLLCSLVQVLVRSLCGRPARPVRTEPRPFLCCAVGFLFFLYSCAWDFGQQSSGAARRHRALLAMCPTAASPWSWICVAQVLWSAVSSPTAQAPLCLPSVSLLALPAPICASPVPLHAQLKSRSSNSRDWILAFGVVSIKQ